VSLQAERLFKDGAKMVAGRVDTKRA